MTAPARTPPPSNYQAALAAAAVLTAAAAARAATPDPAETVLSMAERVIVQREKSSAFARGRIQALWRRVANPYDPQQVSSFLDDSAQVMVSAQTSVARVTAAAQTRQAAALGISGTLTPTNPTDVRGPVYITSDGVSVVEKASHVDYGDGDRRIVKAADSTTREVFNRPPAAYRYYTSQGATDEEARQAGADRIDSLVDDNLMLAQRFAEAEALVQVKNLDDSVVGYRRVIHPELSRGGSCGMCIVASDRIYTVSTLKAIHANCFCTVAAVTFDFDPADHLDVDLNRFYTDAGNSTYNKNLKKTRYTVDEHGELAAVLTPKSREASKTYQQGATAAPTAAR